MCERVGLCVANCENVMEMKTIEKINKTNRRALYTMLAI